MKLFILSIIVLAFAATMMLLNGCSASHKAKTETTTKYDRHGKPIFKTTTTKY